MYEALPPLLLLTAALHPPAIAYEPRFNGRCLSSKRTEPFRLRVPCYGTSHATVPGVIQPICPATGPLLSRSVPKVGKNRLHCLGFTGTGPTTSRTKRTLELFRIILTLTPKDTVLRIPELLRAQLSGTWEAGVALRVSVVHSLRPGVRVHIVLKELSAQLCTTEIADAPLSCELALTRCTVDTKLEALVRWAGDPKHVKQETTVDPCSKILCNHIPCITLCTLGTLGSI